jgi:monofunctional biosynthetic peptidoglycan transglycosylase
VLRRLLAWILRLAALMLVALAGAIVALRWIDPPLTPLMMMRERDGATIDRRAVPIARVSPWLVRAIIAAEDNRFCSHPGVDMVEVKDALETYEESGRLRGASTITMQVARNLFLWPGGGFARKAIEVPLALAIDLAWPKRRVVEIYLNVAEWGDGVFGAEAAAQRHFAKPAAALSRTEAARLAAVLPSPRRWSPTRPGPHVLRSAATIERRIAQLEPARFACALP